MFRKLAESKTNKNFNTAMSEFNNLKLEATNNEIGKIEQELKCMNKTIGNLRIKMKSMVNKEFYEKWTEYINGLGNKFTEMFSAENEELFKKAEKDAVIKTPNHSPESKNIAMENILHRIYSFAKNWGCTLNKKT